MLCTDTMWYMSQKLQDTLIVVEPGSYYLDYLTLAVFTSSLSCNTSITPAKVSLNSIWGSLTPLLQTDQLGYR